MRLGIIGAGKIVKEVLSFIGDIDQIQLAGIVASKKSEQKLKGLCEEYGIEKYYLDYRELIEDTSIDTVYVALPNNLHYQVMEYALDFSKNIICEKPFTSNIRQAEKIFAKAKKKEVLVLEAMSHRYIPNALALKEDIEKLGKIKIVSLNYSQYSSRYDNFRKDIIDPCFSLEYNGGALMDLNVYNVDFAIGLFGRPEDVRYFPNIEKSIDTSGILLMDYGDFKVSCIGSKDTRSSSNSTIQGEDESIEIDGPVNFMKSYRLRIKDQAEEKINKNLDKNRLYYEFVEFADIIEKRDFERMKKAKETTLLTVETVNKARIEAGIFFDSDQVL